MRPQLITAAFFMEGLHDARPGHDIKPDYDGLIARWNKGCIELVDTLVSYAPLTIHLCDAAAIANDGIYPGVFDYEVSSPFGKWFGEHILEHGDEPPKIDAYAWLVNAVGDFFTQSQSAEQACRVKTAINQASLRHAIESL